MHNREITHRVKTDSLSKAQLIVGTKCVVAFMWEKLISKLKNNKKVLWKHNANARFETLKIQIL